MEWNDRWNNWKSTFINLWFFYVFIFCNIILILMLKKGFNNDCYILWIIILFNNLNRNLADLAVAALTITAQREHDIDFTEPFLNLGISILYKRPLKERNEIFSFFSNFSSEIWVLVIAAYIGIIFSWIILKPFNLFKNIFQIQLLVWFFYLFLE